MAVVPKQNGLEILRKLIPLNTLPAESLDRLFDVAVFEKHSKGDRLFKEGDENLQRIYLLSGSLSIKSGKNEVDAISSSSNMARYPIAHQSPRKFTVLAKTKIETVSVDNEFLADLFAGVEDAAYEVNVFEEQVVDDDWMSQLLQSRAFQQIPAANIQNVMMRMEEVRTLAGDVVISQGDEGDYFYLIHKGECLVSLSEDGGESKEVARLGPGDSFGEDALLSDKPRGSTVTMLTNGVLIRLDKQDFVDYVKHPLAGTIGYEEALALVEKGAIWLDVRPTAEHLAGRVPGSTSIPFNNLRRRFDELSSDQHYIVYCKNGQVSTTAAYLLLDHGIEASILKGGLESVDTEQLESAGADEGAEIIQLHTDQNGVPGELVSGGGDNSKEVELLKARLARMEGIAKEQNLTARKIKVVLDQTKEKLDEVEKQNSAANDEKRRLESELSQTLKKLEAQNSAEEARALLEARLVDLQKELDESEEGRLSLEARTSSQESMLKVQAQEHDELTALKIELETLGGALEAADQSDRETQEEVKKLEDECDSQRDEVEHLSGLLEQEATRRESEVSELQTQLTTAAEQAESLQVDLSEREQSGSEQQQRLEQEKRELDEQLTTLREEQEILKGQLKAATEQTESLQVDLSEREQSGSEQQQRLEQEKRELDEQLTILREEQEILKGQLKAATEQTESLQVDLSEREQSGSEQQQRLEQEKRELDEQLTTLREEQETLKGQLKAATEQTESLQVDLSEREQSGSEQQQRLEQEKRELDEQLTTLREEQETLKGQLKAATEQTESLQVDLSEREQSGSEQQQRLEREKSELDEQLTTLREEQEILKGQLKAATEQTESLQVDLSEREQSGSEQQQRLEREKSELDEQLTTLREEQETLKGQLKAATEQTESLQSDLVEHEQSGDEEQQRLEQEKGELVEQLATLREEQQSLKGELTEREQSVGEQQQRLERERGELKEQLVTLQEEQETLKEALKTATEQTESLQSELAEQEQSGDEDLQRLEQEKGELEAQLTTLREEEASRLAEGESTLVDWQRQIDSLQKKLAESEASKQRVEEQSTSREGELALRESEHEELIVLKKELEEIGSALDEVGASDKEAREAIEALETERDNQRQELELLEGALAQASVLQSRLDEVVEEKAVVEQEAHRLSGEVEELRSIMQQYAEQIEAAQQGGGAEEVTALQAELELVREQAEEDMAQLRQALESAEEELAAKPAELEGGSSDDQVVMLQLELEEARAKIRESELTGSVEATESEAVRQEMDSLQSSLDERRRELEKSRKDSLLLEERIEEGNSEIDRLKLALEASQDDMDEAEFSRNEAQEAKKQVEEALYKVQQKIESDRPVDGLTDERLASKKQVLDIESTSPLKSLMVSGLVGAVAAFGLVEIFSIMSGGGEIIGRILQQEKPPVQVEMPANTPLQTVPGSVPLQSQPVAKRPVQEKPQVSSTEVPQTAPAGKFVQPEVKPAVPVIKETATGTLIQDRLTGGGRAPDMVYIRGGEFIMGSDRSQLASEERPSHKVSVGSFAIGRYEVTFDEYALFVRATDRKLPDDLGWGRGRRPVMNVSWDDASAYAAWLSRRTGKGYRLPTEAEWEYAAAAGSDTTYWWGFQIGENRANCFNCGSPWDHKSTAVVGRFEANPFGLHNSAGNVMEWVADCYHGNYQGAPVDGSAWVDAGCRERVVRGGAFNKPGDSLRTTKRGHHDADAKLFVVGFRLARDL